MLKFVFPNICQKNTNIKQTLMVYKVPPGDISANNYGRGHMKPSHQVSYDMRLPLYKKFQKNFHNLETPKNKSLWIFLNKSTLNTFNIRKAQLHG